MVVKNVKLTEEVHAKLSNVSKLIGQENSATISMALDCLVPDLEEQMKQKEALLDDIKKRINKPSST